MKNYRIWVRRKGSNVSEQQKVRLTKELLEQIQKDQAWVKEGQQKGIHRLVQWDFVGAAPDEALSGALKAAEMPFSENVAPGKQPGTP